MPFADPDMRCAANMVDLFAAAAEQLRESPLRHGSRIVLPASGKLLVTGDLHDNLIHFRKILRLARLEAGAEHHVVLHELIHGDKLVNGLDLSHRMLGRVAALMLEHPGQVHPMLANHELAQMTGSAVSKGAGNSTALFNDALDYVFGDEAVEIADAIDEFLGALPLAVTSESGIHCSHSLPSAARMDRFDMGILDRPLEDADLRGPNGSAYMMVWGRGYTARSVLTLAEAWGVKLFCVGHHHVPSGIEIRADRVVVLNSDHEQARVLPIDLAAPFPAEVAILGALPLASVSEG